MAKKSQRRSVRYEKDQLGCMWGLINIFDFRHGRPTWKLISDKRHGSKQAVGTGPSGNKFEVLSDLDENFQDSLENNVNTTATVTGDACKPSVKKLMEEEMSNEQDIKKEINNDEVGAKQSESRQTRKNQKRTKNTHKKSRDMDTDDFNGSETLETGCSCNQNLEPKSSSDRGIDEIMEEVCCQIHQKYINCVNRDVDSDTHVKPNYKHSDFEEKLCVTIKEFMNQKFSDGKHLTEDQKIHHFKELMELLETLSSDEELFLKLLQDPNSLLAKYVLNLPDSQSEKDKDSKSNSTEQKLGDLKQAGELALRKHRYGELALRKHRYFFRKKSKPQERYPAEANDDFGASKKIVILKPGPTVLLESEAESNTTPESRNIVRSKGPNERIGSHFFLSEIKRKLKNAMGKQQHGVQTMGIPNRLPYGIHSTKDGDKGIVKGKVGSSPPIREHLFIERIARPLSGIKRADKSGKMKESEIHLKHDNPGISNQRVSNIYIEAKRHLSEMLSNGDAGADFSGQQFPKTLGRILCIPEYSVSPRGSPGRDSELGFVTAQMRLSPHDKVWRANDVWSPKQEKNVSPLGVVSQNLENRLAVSDNKTDCDVEPPNSPPKTSVDLTPDNVAEETHVIHDKMDPEGDIEIEIVAWEEDSIMDAPSEPTGSFIAMDEESSDMTEIVDDKGYTEDLKQDSCGESPERSSSLASLSSSPITKYAEGSDSAMSISERPSPVSVLEPLFSDEEISPSKTISQPVELPIQPLRIRFEDYDSSAIEEANNAKSCTETKEIIFDFVKAVMQASSFNWDEFCIKWLSSDQLIEPSLREDIELCPNPLCYDEMLLVDCINEVLGEVIGRYYGCFPCVSSVKSIRPVPDMKTAIHEVWADVYWHLLPLPLPHTLDQIVTKDLSRTGAWMDLRFDTETISADMSEGILQDLMEDTILSYVEGSPTSEDALVGDELKENESVVNIVNRTLATF